MKQNKLSGDKWIEKDRDAQEGKQWGGTKRRKTASVIANDGCLHCLALLHGGGFDRHVLFSCKCPFKGYLSNFLPTTLLQSTSPPAQRLPCVLLYTRTFQLIHCSNLTHFSLNYLFIYIYLSSREGPAWVKLKAARTRRGGWSLSGSAWTWGRGDHWTLQNYSKDKRLEVIY